MHAILVIDIYVETSLPLSEILDLPLYNASTKVLYTCCT